MEPISIIPDDLLREIFFGTLPTPREIALSSHPRPMPFEAFSSPLLLRQVCRRWKEIAENYSLLWTTLRIYIPHKVDPGSTLNRDSLVIWTKAWKRLSKGSKLELQLICHTDELEDGLLSVGLPAWSYDRLTKLSLAGDTLPYPSIAALRPDHGFPALEDLVLGKFDLTDSETSDLEKIGPIKAFQDCPRLRRVVVGMVSWEDYFPLIFLPWQQLTHLIIISGAPLAFFTTFLRDSPLLRFLHITPVEELQGDPNPRYAWRWPNLSSVTISFWDPDPATLIFPTHLPLDHVESLRLTGPEFYASGQDDLLLIEAFQSMKSLKHLSLCFSAIGADCYTFTFQNLPQLLTLDIQLRSLWQESDDPLRTFSENPDILPKLTSFTIDIGDGWAGAFSTANWASFVKDCTARKALRQLVVYIAPDSYGALAFIKRLNRLKEGLERGTVSGFDLDLRITTGQRNNLQDIYHWVERDEELVQNWPEARNAFVTDLTDSDTDTDTSADSDSDSDSEYTYDF